MKKSNIEFYIGGLIFAFCIFNFMGCVVRTYTVTKDRVDQDLTSGNRGYLAGQGSGQGEEKERKLTRKTQVVELELHPPIRFETRTKVGSGEPQKAQAEEKDQEVTGNRGYILGGPVQQVKQRFEKYTVRKGDTLQKISQKLYGTSKKWTKIYEANKDKLKAPDKIYAGQVLNVPVEVEMMKEPAENLK